MTRALSIVRWIWGVASLQIACCNVCLPYPAPIATLNHSLIVLSNCSSLHGAKVFLSNTLSNLRTSVWQYPAYSGAFSMASRSGDTVVFRSVVLTQSPNASSWWALAVMRPTPSRASNLSRARAISFRSCQRSESFLDWSSSEGGILASLAYSSPDWVILRLFVLT